MDDVFTIQKPEKPLPLVFDSPHSGTIWPDDFKPAASKEDILKTVDLYVDELFSAVPAHGGSLLLAHFPRSYIDVNRAADDIDPQVLSGPWPEAPKPSARSKAGIGLIRRLLRPGIPLYNNPLPPAEIQNRIERYYTPYHKALQDLINEAYEAHGQACYINCHSMPASTAFPKRNRGMIGHEEIASDFVLGNRDGSTCDAGFTHAIYDYLRNQGFRVTLNDPFKGVELVRRHGNPTRGKHALQLEINKSLYMNEETGEKLEGYEDFKSQIDSLIGFCAEFVT